MRYDNHYMIKYDVQGENGVESRTCYPVGDYQKESLLGRVRKIGAINISCRKLYPISTMKNQHNFFLIYNISFNRMSELEDGHDEFGNEVKWDSEEYDRLEEMRAKAEEFMHLPLPVAFLPYEQWKEANEMIQNAIIHRQEACIRNGRPDLVTLC